MNTSPHTVTEPKLDSFELPFGNGLSLKLRERTHIMGIVNVTPDSFSDGGKFLSKDRAVEHALELVEEGADILDVGGESSRPGSDPVSLDTEMDRVIPVVDGIRKFSSCPISIDTTKAVIAIEALEHGANIINDISALRFDWGMVDVAVKYDAPVILMHMLGMPKTMQIAPAYRNVVGEIISFFQERCAFARSYGVRKLLIDPGFGFGKTVEHNLEMLQRLSEFQSVELPLVIGTSRKSFIGALTGDDAQHRLAGTIATNVYAIMHGAQILRVHDVKEIKRAALLADALRSQENQAE